jgi:phage pi2 protein 07
MWWVVKRSNPEMLHIYEPLTPDLLNLWNRSFSELHGLPIWVDYHHHEFEKIKHNWIHRWRELQSKYEWDVLPRDVDEVKPLFDLLLSLNMDVTIQPNRCHLILRDLAKEYDCKFIHIIRNPVDTWLAHTVEPKDQSTLKRIVKSILFFQRDKLFITKLFARRESIGNSYYLNSVYDLVSRYFDCNYAEDYLDKLLTVWTVLNYEAWKQAKNRGMVVYYERVVRNPKFWFEKMEKFSGVKFDQKYADELSPRFITTSNELRETFVDRLDELGLLDMVNDFYPPQEWFG